LIVYTLSIQVFKKSDRKLKYAQNIKAKTSLSIYLLFDHSKTYFNV